MKIKKILFLTFKYPYGEFGASTHCTTKIIEELCSTQKYEIHCCSHYDGHEGAFDVIPEVIIHKLPIAPDRKKIPALLSRIFFLFRMPIYPLNNIWSTFKHYKACKKVCREDVYDLVIAQCFPLQSVLVGTLLKRNKYINNLMVIFWDNIYGTLPKRVIPKRFALNRQKKLEEFVARYSDLMVSLYPIKAFHEEYGDVPSALGKRMYLGVPKVLPPIRLGASKYDYVIKKEKINILYSGNIFRKEYVEIIVKVLNQISFVNEINLVFFSKGIKKEEFSTFKSNFNGTISDNGWIPVSDLLSLYKDVDFFLSFPGNPNAIRSKCFEYMSYGAPLILLYDADSDVNVHTFSKYPRYISVKLHKDVKENAKALEQFILFQRNKKVPFFDVERLFAEDSPKAYVNLINNYLLDI